MRMELFFSQFKEFAGEFKFISNLCENDFEFCF